MKDRFVDIDTVCYLSEKGHRNFLYPSMENSKILRAGTILEMMPYIPMLGLYAYKVTSSSVRDSHFNNQYSIIWIRKDRVVSRDFCKSIK